jgi:hypothetical protein
MDEDYKTDSSYELEKHELLTKLGFAKIIRLGAETLWYEHPLIPGEFNFKAYSIDGMVKYIWQLAFNDGRRSKLQEIQSVLEVE